MFKKTKEEINCNVLFLSSSDIDFDSRILKQIKVFQKVQLKVFCVGLKYANSLKFISDINYKFVRVSPPTKKLNKFNFSIRLISRKFYILLRILTISIKTIVNSKTVIIHCSEHYLLPLAVLLKFLSRAKLVYDAHELESDTAYISKAYSLYVKTTEKLLWRYIDYSIFVSEPIAEWYTKNIGTKDFIVVYNSPIISNSVYSKNYLRTKFNISSQHKIFLYLGMLSDGRGIDLILSSFPALEAQASVIFMGEGPLKNRVINYSRKYKNIFIHDVIAHDQVVNCAESADYGLCMIENVSLSDYYSLPNKFFEYIFANLLVVIPDYPALNKIATAHNCGLISSHNRERFIKDLIHLCESDSFKQHQFTNLDILSWKSQEEKLLRMIDKILTNS